MNVESESITDEDRKELIEFLKKNGIVLPGYSTDQEVVDEGWILGFKDEVAESVVDKIN